MTTFVFKIILFIWYGPDGVDRVAREEKRLRGKEGMWCR